MHICMRPRPYWSFENNGLSLYLSWFLVAKSWQRIAWWKANYFVYLNLVAGLQHMQAGSTTYTVYSLKHRIILLCWKGSIIWHVVCLLENFIMASGYLIETNLSSCINCRGGLKWAVEFYDTPCKTFKYYIQMLCMGYANLVHDTGLWRLCMN